MDYILVFAVLGLILIFFRLLLGWFTKYFDEIIVGVNKLVKKEKEPIVMSKELGFMEEKLKDVYKRQSILWKEF